MVVGECVRGCVWGGGLGWGVAGERVHTNLQLLDVFVIDHQV